MDISMNRNGSGMVTINYRISRVLESLGRLDGNEDWNTVPVGKADFERTIERLPGVKLLSFASKEDDINTVIDVKLEFSSPGDLIAFLDASGQKADFSGDGNSGRMVFSLSDSNGIKNSGLQKLIADITENCTVRIGMTFHDQAELSLLDNSGKTKTIPGSEIHSPGKTVSLLIPLFEILSAEGGIKAEFRWQ